MLDLKRETPAELQALIAEAQQQLVEKRKAMRKGSWFKSKNLRSLSVQLLKLNTTNNRKTGGDTRGAQTGKVAAKYQNPLFISQ